MTKENQQLFFVVRKDKWTDHYKYTIMQDKAFTLEEATRKVLAYEEINADKDHTYHLNKVDEWLEDTKETVILENGANDVSSR